MHFGWAPTLSAPCSTTDGRPAMPVAALSGPDHGRLRSSAFRANTHGVEWGRFNVEFTSDNTLRTHYVQLDDLRHISDVSPLLSCSATPRPRCMCGRGCLRVQTSATTQTRDCALAEQFGYHPPLGAPTRSQHGVGLATISVLRHVARMRLY